ncbi:hypothetical protein [Saccharibacillus endophyticus]|uniref:Yip1 domain-containing protein n=1 Tax=Saccharibacillus endophyticus TaxID=2060666 RepID=A0ABQ1ZV38_9BACL|nr:hypothetical protein [Saccharibacillus endophyticus]GGH77944.1 hypothetical protein GCM10007362_22460 [Saccharibacillus endophyticus]
MAYCTNCGTEIQTGEIHVCPLDPKESRTSEENIGGVSLGKHSAEGPKEEAAQPFLAPHAAPAIPAPLPAVAQPVTEGPSGHARQPGQPGQSSAASATASRFAEAAKGEWNKLDTGKLLGLLKNPLSALRLRGDSDLMLGIFGIVSPILGFLIWAWALKRSIVNSVAGGLSDIGFFGDDLGALSGTLSSRITIVGPLFAASIVSVVILLAVAYLLGNWRGQEKQSSRDGIVSLGGVQLFAGAVFLVSALLVFVSPSLSMLLLTGTILLAFVFTQYAAIRMFRIPEERVSLFLVLTVAIQVVAVAIILGSFSSQLADGFQRVIGGF